LVVTAAVAEPSRGHSYMMPIYTIVHWAAGFDSVLPRRSARRLWTRFSSTTISLPCTVRFLQPAQKVALELAYARWMRLGVSFDSAQSDPKNIKTPKSYDQNSEGPSAFLFPLSGSRFIKVQGQVVFDLKLNTPL